MAVEGSLPILLIPVYRGGRFFEQAFDSIVPCLQWFDRCIVSLNGMETDADRVTAHRLGDFCDLQILETHRILNPVQHLLFIANALTKRLGLDVDAQLFILCHDDLLRRSSFEELDEQAWRGFRSDMVGFGDFYTFTNDDPPGLVYQESWFSRTGRIGPQPRSDFVKTQCAYKRQHDPFTNLSGVRVSVGVFHSTLRYFALTGSRTGMRIEYSLIINRRIRSLLNYVPPLVCVRVRYDSAGALTTRKDFVASELRYAIWLWLNTRTVDECRQLFAGDYSPRGVWLLMNVVLLHRYYEFQGSLKSFLVRIGVLK
ncbi:MAG: hypothetical protein VKM34_08580 [Cyanobacteriota bacterium]|nr:hypothetical protein [Cyanobacteriota bacterium]